MADSTVTPPSFDNDRNTTQATGEQGNGSGASSSATNAPKDKSNSYWSKRKAASKAKKGGGKSSALIAPPPATIHAGVPKPSALSTSSSVLRNDPCLTDSVAVVDAIGMVPKAEVPSFEVDLSGFPSLCRAVYYELTANDKNFRRHVSEAMFSYYCNQHLVARLIAIRCDQGVSTPVEEEHFRNMEGNLWPVPGFLDPYLRSIGDFALPIGKRYKIKVPPQDELDLAKITAANHRYFMAYPHPTIDALRIVADLSKSTGSGSADWEIDSLKPDDIGTHSPGKPTANLFGYRRAINVPSECVNTLEQIGVDGSGFEYEGHSSFHFNRALMSAIGSRLSQMTSSYAIAPGPHRSRHGSVVNGLTIKTHDGTALQHKFSRNTSWLDNTLLRVLYSQQMDPKLLVGSIACAFRITRSSLKIKDTAFRCWSVYDWDEYKHVPDTWNDTVNDLYCKDDTLGLLSLSSAGHSRANFLERITKHAVKKSTKAD